MVRVAISSRRLGAVMMFTSVLLTAGCGGGSGGGAAGSGVASYTVGGTVTGLTGSGLVLQNHGVDDLAVSGNSFVFATAIPGGGSYAVTVKSQPDTQLCSVTNGSGKVEGGPVTHVSVTCRGWHDAQLIDIPADGAGEPAAAFDGAGNGMAVWSQLDGTYRIRASRFTVGAGWGVPEAVQFGITPAVNPQVAMDANGNAVVVWNEDDGLYLKANHYSVGAGWGTPVLLETANSGYASHQQLASDRDGNVVVVWKQGDGTTASIYTNRYTPGTGWSGRMLLERSDTPADAPDVAVDGSGNAIVVWQQHEGTKISIWANRYTPESGWGGAQIVENNDSDDATEPRVAMNDSGEAFVVWKQYDGIVNSIWSVHYTPAGGWDIAKPIEDDDTGSAYQPVIAVDAQGNAIAIWCRNAGADYSVWANRFIPGSGWSGATRITAGQLKDVMEPRVAFAANGNILTLWVEYDGTDYSLWSSHYDVGTGWSPPAVIERVDGYNVGQLALAVDGAGNALAVWDQSDGSVERIWASRFE